MNTSKSVLRHRHPRKASRPRKPLPTTQESDCKYESYSDTETDTETDIDVDADMIVDMHTRSPRKHIGHRRLMYKLQTYYDEYGVPHLSTSDDESDDESDTYA